MSTKPAPTKCDETLYGGPGMHSMFTHRCSHNAVPGSTKCTVHQPGYRSPNRRPPPPSPSVRAHIDRILSASRKQS